MSSLKKTYNVYSKKSEVKRKNKYCFYFLFLPAASTHLELSMLRYWEKAMAPHSSTLAWKTPWTEEPGGLQSMGSLRVGHNWATSLSRIGEGNGNPLQCSCLENARDGGAWWAVVSGVTQSRTRLKQLSSSMLRCYLLRVDRESLYILPQTWISTP